MTRREQGRCKLIYVYFVRHGENYANLRKEFSYRLVDYDLTPKGVLQAQQTATLFRDRRLDAVYASPLKRAAQTAEIIAAVAGLPVTLVEEFRELNVGALEHNPPTPEAWALHDQIVAAWRAGQPDPAFPEGEDLHMLRARMRQGWEKIWADGDDRTVLVAGHGGSFGLTMTDLCPGLDPSVLRGGQQNCALTELRLTRQNGRITGELLRWAACDHLTGEAADFVSGHPEPTFWAGRKA